MLVECADCGAIVDGLLLSEYEDTEEESGMTGKYSFLKCPRCSRPFIMLQVDDGPGWDEPRRLYPPVEMGVSLAIPATLRSAFSEARVCFRAKAYTATVIMCRKVLEGIAEENRITARNLVTSLNEMREKGIIENRLFEWADALRISGNEAAHGVSLVVSATDAKDILEFTHALLEYVFTFQEKFEEFKIRHKAEKKK
jgi:DNA-directed RNA polymerase subunit RPC12/RpoP